MPIESAVNLIEYSGNNSTVSTYAVPFRFDSAAWLTVLRIDDDGTTNLIPLGDALSDIGAYNVIEITPFLKAIRTTVAVPASSRLVISRYAPATQTLSLVPNSPLPAKDLEAALDRLVMALQDRDPGRGNPFFKALAFPQSEPPNHSTSLPLPHLRKNHLIHFHPDTGELTLIPLPDLAQAISDILPINGPAGPAGPAGPEGPAGPALDVPDIAAGDMLYRNSTQIVRIPAPAAPAAGTIHILTHNGTAPAWTTKDILSLSYCVDGDPTTGNFIQL